MSVDYGEICILAVERVVDIEETGDTFERPEKFDPAELLGGAFNSSRHATTDPSSWSTTPPAGSTSSHGP